MVRRQETPRLLAGRNEANPLEFQSAFNLTSGAQGVPGVQGARELSGGLDDTYSQAIGAIGEFASSTFREAAKTRYEKKAMDGAMAYQQGKSIDELPMDGNKWMLEGYRVMEAETAATALFAAQQTEITQGLFELDPDGFRQRYTDRMEGVLAGHDTRTQELIKQRMMEQMPRLVDQHTREHMKHREQQNFDALTTSVAQMSIDPEQADKLVAFAKGEAGSQGLSTERRRGALIRGIQTAYENDNPLAYSILKQQGALDEMSMEETQALRASQQAYENRRRNEYDEQFFTDKQNLTNAIERGEFPNPMDAVAAWSSLLTENGITMNYTDAANAFGSADTANQYHHRALNLEIQTAKSQGDFAKVAELSAPFARSAGSGGQHGEFYNAMSQFEAGGYDTLFGNSEDQRGVRVSQMTIGELKDFSSPSGEYGQWVARTRNDGRRGQVATPMGKFQIVGSTLRRAAEQMGLPDNTVFTPDVQRDIAAHLAQQRLASATTMPGKIAALRNEWDGFNKASESTMIAIVEELEGRGAANHDYGQFNNERWSTMVEFFDGDLELASVAYASEGNAKRAQEWDAQGRPDYFLNEKERSFQRRVNNEVTGHRHVTAQSRAALAETMYNRVAESNAVDLYARVEPQLRGLDNQFVRGDMSKDDWRAQRNDIFSEYGLERSIASVDREMAVMEQRVKAMQGIAEQQQAEDYAQRLMGFNVARADAERDTQDAIRAIMDSVPGDGVSPTEHRNNQVSEIERIQNEFRQSVMSGAQELGIKLPDQKIEELLIKSSNDFKDSIDQAQRQAMERAETDRAIQEGRLNHADRGLAHQAWEEANAQAIQRAKRNTVGVPADEQQEAQAQLHQQYMEDWTARTGFVPDEVRNTHNAAMLGELIQDGEVNPRTVDAITSYGSMKQRNRLAAKELMSPEAAAVADAVLMLTNGNEDQMPGVIRQLWVEGLEKAFRGDPLPDFMERADVRGQVQSAIKGTRLSRFAEAIFGTQPGSFRSLGLPPSEMDALEGVVIDKIEKIHSIVPGLNPKYIIDNALEQVADSIVVMPRNPDASFFERNSILRRRGEDSSGRPGSLTGNTFLLDPYGGNVREQVFGATGGSTQYNNDHVVQAIGGYIHSEQFRTENGLDFEVGNFDITPLGNGEVMVEIQPSRGTQLQRFGQGIVDTIFGEDLPDTFPIMMTYEQAGEWFKKQDKAKLTDR